MNNKKLRKIKGSTMIEYVLLIGLVGGTAIISMTSVGNNISTFFNKLSTVITAASLKM